MSYAGIIEDQAKNLKSMAHPYDQRTFSPLDSTANMASPQALAIYMSIAVNFNALATGKSYWIEMRQIIFLCWMQGLNLQQTECPLTNRLSYRGSYIHTYIHTYMHACMRACFPTHKHTYVRTYIHSYTHAYTHACMHTCIHNTYIHVLILIFMLCKWEPHVTHNDHNLIKIRVMPHVVIKHTTFREMQHHQLPVHLRVFNTPQRLFVSACVRACMDYFSHFLLTQCCPKIIVRNWRIYILPVPLVVLKHRQLADSHRLGFRSVWANLLIECYRNHTQMGFPITSCARHHLNI